MYDAVILIVDDEQTYLDSISETLSKRNFKIVQALNGKMGIMVAQKFRPDIIIADWEMPEMNGIEMIAQLKNIEQTKDIPVIMCTGIMTTSENLNTALQAGAIDYIRKPVDPIELTARINSALNLSASFKKIKAQNDELQILNKTKDKFFGIIAHDLRNPFGAIFGLSEILVNTDVSNNIQEQKRYLNLIYNAARSGHELLENLLQWALSQSGSMEYNPDRIKISKIIEKSVLTIENNALIKNINIKNQVSDDIWVYADFNLTLTILRNLLSNAVKFTPKNGQVIINAKTTTGNATISITDNGLGIAPERIEKLFHLHAKENTYGTENEKGTGLGLNLCKEFVERQAGKIWVESELGHGSTFYFTLPVNEII